MLIQKDLFSSQHPKEEGTYLWLDDYIDTVELIHVKYYKPKTEYGIEWVAYLGVVEYQNRHISQLSGKFLKINIK